MLGIKLGRDREVPEARDQSQGVLFRVESDELTEREQGLPVHELEQDPEVRDPSQGGRFGVGSADFGEVEADHGLPVHVPEQIPVDTVLVTIDARVGMRPATTPHMGSEGFAQQFLHLIASVVEQVVVGIILRMPELPGDGDDRAFRTVLPNLAHQAEIVHLTQVSQQAGENVFAGVVHQPLDDGAYDTPIEFSHNSSLNLGGMPPFFGCKIPLGTFANIIIT